MGMATQARDTRDTKARDAGTQRQGRRGAALPLRYGLVALGSALLWYAGASSYTLLSTARPLPWGALATAGATGAALLCLVAATLAVPVTLPRRARRPLCLTLGGGMCALALVWFVVLTGSLYETFGQPPARAYITDTVAYAQIDAELVLRGSNPYIQNDALAEALRRYPEAHATPLRQGVFGTGNRIPPTPRVARVEHAYLAAQATHSPAPAGFDARTLHSYPALSFLLYVPLIWAGVPNILMLHVALYVLLFGWLVWLAPAATRGWAALVATSAVSILLYSLLRESEIVCVACVLLAWHHRERRWTSAVLLGLGCAFKQYCWFFAPFFFVEAWCAYGWREAARRGAITGAAFLLPNLPYIVASPAAWWTSIWLPVSDPLFPSGQGLIALSTGLLVPYAPPLAYALLEVAALGACLAAYARWRGALREAALVLALVPLAFAFRSLPDYFAFAPWLALYGATQALTRSLTASPTELPNIEE